jgi:FHS family Na+ dependent glucose MFS transporter 1
MPAHKKRWIILYFSISLYVGMSSAIFGPSLINLVEQTNSSLSQLSYMFSGSAFAYLAGSWLSGRLFDRYRGHYLLTIFLPAVGAGLFVVPFIQNPLILISVAMLVALTSGLIDVGGNTLLIRIPDINLGPAMNGLHFFFGLGSFLAPLFLAGSLQLTEGIEWGYWGFGLFSILLLIQFIRLPEAVSPNSLASEEKSETDSPELNQRTLIWLIALFYFAFVGVEIGYGNWLSSYAFKMELVDEKTSILLTSIYWGAFTISRLISIPLSVRLKPRVIVICDIIGSMIGLGLVFLFPYQPSILWVGTILLGISVASLFPTMLTYAEGLIKMTGKVTSIFFISGSVGSIILPWIIGQSVESTGAIIIVRVLFYTLCAAAVVLILLLRMDKRKLTDQVETKN